MESCVNWDGPVSMVPCVHQENIYTNRKLRVWRDQKCIPLVGAKTLVICAGLQNTPSRGRQYRGPRTESWVNWDGHMAMVPGLHQGNIYTKRKLRVWRDQKCTTLVGAITPLTCAGSQNTQSRGKQYRAQYGKFGKLGRSYGHGTEMCLHQGNIHTKRKLRVWRDQRCIPLVGIITPLTCAGSQNTLSRGRKDRSQYGKLHKL